MFHRSQDYKDPLLLWLPPLRFRANLSSEGCVLFQDCVQPYWPRDGCCNGVTGWSLSLTLGLDRPCWGRSTLLSLKKPRALALAWLILPRPQEAAHLSPRDSQKLPPLAAPETYSLHCCQIPLRTNCSLSPGRPLLGMVRCGLSQLLKNNYLYTTLSLPCPWSQPQLPPGRRTC